MSTFTDVVPSTHKRERSASLGFEKAAHTTDFRQDPQTSTRGQCKLRRDFGLPPSCHMVKTYELIFVAFSKLGYPIYEKNYTFAHDIKELLYTSLNYGLARTVFADQTGSLKDTIRAHFKDNANIDETIIVDFIAKINFLQEFNIIVSEYTADELDYHLERATNENFEEIWSKMQTGKEYFILFSGNEERRMHAVHYFICGKSESEDTVKIYSAWGSDRVQNAFKSMQLNKEMFRAFVSSINRHQPGQCNQDFHKFLMDTMLRPENERYGMGTIETANLAESSTAYQLAKENIEEDIACICGGNLGLYRVPAYHDKGHSYLDTLTEVIKIGINAGLFVNAPQESASSTPSQNEKGGARKTRKHKISRRIRRYNRGKTIKRRRTNKRTAIKVQTKRIIKRKKPKSTKLLRHHIVKK